MNTEEPIIIVEDDMDDQEVMTQILTELNTGYKIMFFDNGQNAFEYLLDENIVPFIIFSDINMPGMSGFQLKDKIQGHDGLRSKCMPFLFLTTGGEARFIWEAYSKNAQGYFIKPRTLSEWKELFYTVIKYWEKSKKPGYND